LGPIHPSHLQLLQQSTFLLNKSPKAPTAFGKWGLEFSVTISIKKAAKLADVTHNSKKNNQVNLKKKLGFSSITHMYHGKKVI
jgi:hypothetical protein